MPGQEAEPAEVDLPPLAVVLAHTAQTWALILDRLAGYAVSGTPQPFFPAAP